VTSTGSIVPETPPPSTRDLLPQLSLDEKAAMTAGSGFFTMTGVPRLGIPNWGTTDGPNGARGSSFLGSGDSMATCLPCGTALGATWNPALVEEVGVVLGRETRTKQARVLLAPTVNLHRSPLAGRNFECISEDPLLTGLIAAAYIRGVQSQGVITTVKHFLGNECETDRWTSNSLIDERALRELYLVPFEYAVKEGRTLGIMTSYNRVNGAYCTEHQWLLQGILRDEWGFEGFVTTDWMAGADTELSARAGLDIEMPSGDRAFGAALAEAVRDGRVAESTLDEIAGRLLGAFERINAWHDEPGREQSIDRPEHRALARRASADAIVLLRNEPVDGSPLLPLDASTLTSVAIIGPNAARAQMMGGGSANLRPFHRTSPLDVLRRRLGDQVTITYEPGCSIDKSAPPLGGSELVAPDGSQGFAVELFDTDDWSGPVVATSTRDTSRILFGDASLPGVTGSSFSMWARSDFTAGATGTYRFEITQVGRARVLIDGETVLDGITDPPRAGSAFFGFGSLPVVADVELEAGRTYAVLIELTASDVVMFAGVELGVRRPMADDSVERAAAAARAADVAIVVVGTNDDWETEGEDRRVLGLPGRQDELVASVVAANPRTIVVVNTGSPVTMPWAGDIAALVQSWFGGQEMADALLDVLLGVVEPGGRLPTTYPLAIEHTPSFANFPGDNDQVHYAEGIFVGYRWYDSRRLATLFPFGHGLSYTTFAVGSPALSATVIDAPDGMTNGGTGDLTVGVTVTNTGPRAGSHVVQCYVRPRQSRLVRPDKELKAFAKVTLAPGESETVQLRLDARSFAYWDPAQPEWPALRARTAATLPQLRRVERRTEPGWTVDPGEYEILIADSSDDIRHTAIVTVR
jgi:beta-glucosidase